MRDPEAGADMPAEVEGNLQVRRLDVTDPSSFDLPSDLRVLVNNAGIDTDYLPVEHATLTIGAGCSRPTCSGSWR